MNPIPLPADAGPLLLALARGAIAHALGAPACAAATAPWLATPGATFVTLNKAGKLRGCIGSLEARRALAEDVRANAVAAALHDPRFPGLTVEELPVIAVEVSLLTAPQPIGYRDEADALAQLVPGTDGIVFEYGHHRSTFLPQVWAEIATPAEFMGHLKYKAGLPPDFWDPAVKLSRYAVTQWREDDPVAA